MQAPTPAGLPMPSAPDDGAPPMGSSPATGPTPNAGADVQNAQHASLVVDAAVKLAGEVGATSELGQLLLDFVKKATKLVQPGAVSPAAKQNQMDQMQRNNAQNGRNMSMLKQTQQPAQQAQPGA